jgi:WD40 repeat protein
LLFIADASPGLGQLDPNILWVSDSIAGYFDGFAVHPNGNVLAYKHSVVTELDGKTGKFIRKFPAFENMGDINKMKISSDGKYIVTCYGETNIVNYETGLLVKRILNMGKVSIFPDNNRIIGLRLSGVTLDSALTIYDIEKDKFEYYKLDYSYSNLELSPDGKYFATGIILNIPEGSTKYYTNLKLWDTEKHTMIKLLGQYEGSNNVRYIKFSSDSKYVGFQVYLFDLYIFNTSDFSLFKHYNENNTKLGVTGFSFINNKYITFYGTEILDLNDDKQIFATLTPNGPYPIIEYNKFNNTLVVAANKINAYDLNKIMTFVKEINTEQKFTVTYLNGMLSLDKIPIDATTLSITILDINGKIIRQLNIPYSNGAVKIPMKLINGTYILSIKDGYKEYSSKFLVTE